MTSRKDTPTARAVPNCGNRVLRGNVQKDTPAVRAPLARRSPRASAAGSSDAMSTTAPGRSAPASFTAPSIEDLARRLLPAFEQATAILEVAQLMLRTF